MTVLVCGATGAQGGSVINVSPVMHGAVCLHREAAAVQWYCPCLQALLHAGGFQVRGLTRNKASPAAQKLQAAGAQVVQGNLSDPSSLEEVCPCCWRTLWLLCMWHLPHTCSWQAPLAQPNQHHCIVLAPPQTVHLSEVAAACHTCFEQLSWQSVSVHTLHFRAGTAAHQSMWASMHTITSLSMLLQAFKGADYLFIVTNDGVVDPKAELQQGRNAADAAEQARPCTDAKASVLHCSEVGL